MEDSPLDLIHLLPVALDRLALAVIVGGSAVAAWLLPSGTHRAFLVQPLRRLFDIALPILLLSSFALLWLRTAAMADVPVAEAGPYLWRVIGHSQFGTIWLSRLAALAIMAVIWFGSTRKTANSASFALIFVAGLVISVTISGTSHAGDEGLLTVTNIVNSLHICAGASWGGAVIAYLLLLRHMSHHRFEEDIAAGATRLSLLATIALAAVVPSGIYNAWAHIPELADLWRSPYGETLLAKLVFVVMMMTIGALNRFRVIPGMLRAIRIGTGTAQRRPEQVFINVLTVDVFVFVSVMSSAAALGLQGPPMS